jgi:DNA-binding FrmR family transcriptional regulator
LLRMVSEDRYCVDILTQINAVQTALHKVEEQILRGHVSHCVAGAFAKGNVIEDRAAEQEGIGRHYRTDDEVGMMPRGMGRGFREMQVQGNSVRAVVPGCPFRVHRPSACERPPSLL